MTCAACGTDLGPRQRMGRREGCPRCGADLHSCRHCRFHDRAAYNECREPQAERVLDKAAANFCDYFAPRDAAPAAARPAAGRGPARDELERLFRRR